MQTSDRRRNPPPPGPTYAPIPTPTNPSQKPAIRDPTTPRPIFLKTSLIPSSTGSAYYETSPNGIKLLATIAGPKPLPRNTPFHPNLFLTASVKYTPFATPPHLKPTNRLERGGENKDLSAQLETALRGVVVAEKYPKAAVEVGVLVLEGGEDEAVVLAAAITAAGAAVVDAGIEVVGLLAAGYSAMLDGRVVVDPMGRVASRCVVAYLKERDEVVLCWMTGRGDVEALVNGAVEAAGRVRGVVELVLLEEKVAGGDAGMR